VQMSARYPGEGCEWDLQIYHRRIVKDAEGRVLSSGTTEGVRLPTSRVEDANMYIYRGRQIATGTCLAAEKQNGRRIDSRGWRRRRVEERRRREEGEGEGDIRFKKRKSVKIGNTRTRNHSLQGRGAQTCIDWQRANRLSREVAKFKQAATMLH
jgi:hypothetical protein